MSLELNDGAPAPTFRQVVCAAAVAAALVGAPGGAWAGDVSKSAALVVRVLAYDSSVAKRADGQVAIGLLFNPNSPESVATSSAMVAAFGELAARQKIGGLPIVAVPVPLPAGTAVDGAVAGHHLTALYVCPGLDGLLGKITALSRRRSILSFTGTESHVDAGIAVGLLERGGKSRILIHTDAAGAEGARLAPGLLRLAELYQAGGSDSAAAAAPVRLKSGMTPPKPLAETMTSPDYPASLRAARVAGRVVLLIEVRRDGTVGEVKPRSGPPQLAAVAGAAVKSWRFDPALDGGAPVSVWLPYPFVFQLEDGRGQSAQ